VREQEVNGLEERAMEKQLASTPLRVVVFADFVCPYSYLAVDQIDRLAREYDLAPLWRPHWLHPETPPEGTPREPTGESLARRERQLAWIKEMAPEHHARIRIPERRQYSLLAFEAMEFAYDQERDFAYKTALYELMWAEGRDIGETGTLVAAAERVGLDPDEMKTILDERLYAERTLSAINQARDLGITNTPTIFLGRTRINGWHYYEVLQSVIEKQGVQRKDASISVGTHTI
jgi:predicted DsbA family dithiol-disulfide isomerase